jgi:hypothetical protein
VPDVTATDPEFKERVLGALERLERWTEGHDGVHRLEQASRESNAVRLAGEMATLKQQFQNRTLLGALAAIAAAVLGIGVKPPQQ